MSLGSLEFQILADIGKLRRDMADAQSVVDGSLKAMGTAAEWVKGTLLGLGGGLTLAAFNSIVQGAIAGRARLYDMSVQTGISVEALASLGKVAKFSDTSLDDVAAASNKLSKALFTQNEDSKGAAQAIKALGLNFNEFRSLAPDQQFLAVARSMGQFADGSEKSAAAMLLYGKAGAQLLPFLRELEERGLAVSKITTESAKAAKEYEDNLIALKSAGEAWKQQLAGEILPVLVSVTNQLVDGRNAYGGWVKAIFDVGLNVNPIKSLHSNLMDAREEMDKLKERADAIRSKQAGGGFFAWMSSDVDKRALDQIDGKLSTLQQRITYLKQQQAREALAGNDGYEERYMRKGKLKLPEETDEQKAYDALIKSLNEKIATNQAELDVGRQLTEAEKLQAKVYSDIDTGVLQLTLDQKLFVDGKLQAILASEKQAKAQDAENKFLEESLRATEQAIGQAKQRADQAGDAARAMQQQLDEYGKTRAEIDALASARDREAAAQLRARKVAEDLNPALAAMNQELERHAAALNDVATARDALAARQQADAASPLAGAEKALKEYMDLAARVGDATYGAVSNSLRGLEDTLTTFFRTGKLDAKSFIDTVITEFLRLKIVRPMLADLGTSGGGNIFSSLFSAVGSLFGGNYSANNGLGYSNAAGISGGRASGGPVLAGHTYLVGEKGPELLTLGGTGGNVTPNHALGGLNLTSAPTFNIDARADKAQIEARMQQLLAESNKALLQSLKTAGVI